MNLRKDHYRSPGLTEVPGTKQTRRLGSAPAGPEPPSVKNEWRESQPRRVPVRSPPGGGAVGLKTSSPSLDRGGGGARPGLATTYFFCSPIPRFVSVGLEKPKKPRVQLLAVDHSARESMKNAASCEN